MIRSLGARKGCPGACPTRRVASSAVEHSAFNRLVLSSNLRRPIPVTAFKSAKDFPAQGILPGAIFDWMGSEGRDGSPRSPTACPRAVAAGRRWVGPAVCVRWRLGWSALGRNKGYFAHPRPLRGSARRVITEAEGLEIKPLARFSPTEMGALLEYTFSAIAIAPAGCKGHGSLLIERAAVLAIQHVEVGPRDGAAAFLYGLATGRCRLAGFGMGAQQMLNRFWIPDR